jgi:predicted phosphodiesterase
VVAKLKLAVISDIHGNFEAFKAVLTDLEKVPVDDIICLGDCVGYGPEPEQVLGEVIRRNIPTTMGNHEMAVCDTNYLNWFNPNARASIEKTMTMLSGASIQFIQSLPRSRIIGQCRCVHGYPPDSVREYLFQKAPHALIKTFKHLPEPICFVGHTHDLEMVHFDGRQVERWPLDRGVKRLDRQYRYIINVGSVGQPRDGDNSAKYAVYDTDHHELEIRYATYDIAQTVAKIKAAGLPEAHANRLW